jgi:hypothetical protein
MKWIALAAWIGFWIWVSRIDKRKPPKGGADSWN